MRADAGSRCSWRWAQVLLLLALLVTPRVVALDADTLPSLSENSGIWTDEGFYTYNARNAVLFGQAELDEFNNRNLSPVLDAVQRGVFGTFGVGLVPARAISATCGLLALAFFYDALRRVFGGRVAVTGLLLLGGEVTFILYNRLALMETPSVLVLCAAFWGLTRASPPGWLLAGALAVSAVAFKTSFLLLLPLPLLAWLWRGREGDAGARRPALWYGTGAIVGAMLYLAFWGIPRGQEIWRMNNYYRTRQVQPRSWEQVGQLAGQAVMGYRQGLLQFLETRTPILTTVALIGLLAVPRRKRHRVPLSPRAARRRDTLRVLWLWTGIGLLALAISRYAPSRYYLVVYPALAGLAAVTLWRLGAMLRWARARRRVWWAAPLVCAPPFFAVYHLLLPVLYAAKIGPFGYAAQALAAVVTVMAVYGLFPRLRLPPPRRLAGAGLAAFLVVSLGQWAFWYGTRGYRTRDVAASLAGIVRPGETLAGDWAPNLCLNNTVRAIPVLPGLANWRDPVRTLDADYVLVTQTPYPVRYWRKQAPDVIVPANLVRRYTIHDYRVYLYRVPPGRKHAKKNPSRPEGATVLRNGNPWNGRSSIPSPTSRGRS